jgi:adenylate kinase family enzyme
LHEKLGIDVTHLDQIFWLLGGFDEKRDAPEVANIVDSKRIAPSWIVEGIYGDLAQQFASQAEVLIWLDLPWSVCEARLKLRGSESKAHMNREQSLHGLQALVQWACNYPSRQGSSGRTAHLSIFEAFPGQRHHFESEAEVQRYLDSAKHPW